jgi:hypothetical protein
MHVARSWPIQRFLERCSGSGSLSKNRSPHRKNTGKRPNLSHLRVFVCTAYATDYQICRKHGMQNLSRTYFLGIVKTQKGKDLLIHLAQISK